MSVAVSLSVVSRSVFLRRFHGQYNSTLFVSTALVVLYVLCLWTLCTAYNTTARALAVDALVNPALELSSFND